MFVGHYSASLAAKAWARETPLGSLFIAVQWLDVLFFPLAVMGIEKLELTPHGSGAMNFELPYMPYTHSLLAAVLWSLLVALVTLAWAVRGPLRAAATRMAIAMGLAVLSHWCLDLLVHYPDLPLVGNGPPKFGLMLWQWPWLTMALEMSLLGLSLLAYMRRTRASNALGRWGMPVFVGLLTVGEWVNLFAAPNNGVIALAAAAMGSYLGFAAIAGWLDGQRVAA